MTPNCDRVAAELERYLAGAMSESEATLLEAHAGSCEVCAPMLLDRTRLEQRLPAELPPPRETRARVLGKVGRLKQRRRGLRIMIPPAIAATLVLGFGLTQVRSKEAMIRRLESQTPHAVAVSRAWPVLDEIMAARAEIEAEIQRASTGQELGSLREGLRSLDRQSEAFQEMVKEYES